MGRKISDPRDLTEADERRINAFVDRYGDAESPGKSPGFYGKRVILQGLKNEQLNGQKGTVVGYADNGR